MRILPPILALIYVIFLRNIINSDQLYAIRHYKCKSLKKPPIYNYFIIYPFISFYRRYFFNNNYLVKIFILRFASLFFVVIRAIFIVVYLFAITSVKPYRNVLINLLFINVYIIFVFLYFFFIRYIIYVMHIFIKT